MCQADCVSVIRGLHPTCSRRLLLVSGRILSLELEIPYPAQACVSPVSAYSDTIVPNHAICYKSVTNAAGTGCGVFSSTTSQILLPLICRPQPGLGIYGARNSGIVTFQPQSHDIAPYIQHMLL